MESLVSPPHLSKINLSITVFDFFTGSCGQTRQVRGADTAVPTALTLEMTINTTLTDRMFNPTSIGHMLFSSTYQRSQFNNNKKKVSHKLVHTCSNCRGMGISVG